MQHGAVRDCIRGIQGAKLTPEVVVKQLEAQGLRNAEDVTTSATTENTFEVAACCWP